MIMEPTKKIGLGVTALENARSTNPTVSNLAKYAGGVKNLAELIEVAIGISVNADGFSKRIGELKAHSKAQRDKVTAEVNRYRGMSKDQKQTTIRDEVAAERSALRNITSKERYATLSKMKAAADSITAVKSMYRSPNIMLARVQLGTAERSRMQEQMASSGTVELEAFATLAINQSDKLMGACVLARLDAMSAKDRKQCDVSRDEVASILMATEFAKASEAIRVADNRLQSSLNMNHDFELGKDNPVHRIAQGLRDREETGALDDDGDDDE